jgi:adenylate cyclase
VFDSIDGAVRCAVKVQQQVPVLDGEQPPDRAIRFRIGINIGDAIPDGTDLHGDAVNVVARLQAECPAGGICVSRSVRDHVHGRLNLEFEELGVLALKNIHRPVEAFVIRSGGGRNPHHSTVTPLPTGKPSVAVLAFTNMSDNIDQEFFADGVADDVITELSHSHSLLVIARNSSFTYKGRAVDVKLVARELSVRYIVEGSVRRSGARVRVTAQLVDADTGNHLWASRYDRELTDVLIVQDEIARAVTQAVTPAVEDAEQRRVLRKPPESLVAWEAYQRGLWHASKESVDENGLARAFFEQAIVLDPAFASAYSELAWTYHADGSTYASRPYRDAMQLAIRTAESALKIDPSDAEAHAAIGAALINLSDFPSATFHFQRALAVNPNSARAYRGLAAPFLFRGQPARGREMLDAALRLNPRGETAARVRAQIALSYYLERNYSAAVTAAKQAIAEHPHHPWAHRCLAASLGQLGDKEATTALKKAVEVSPESFQFFARKRRPYERPEDHQHMIDGLRKAGWRG